MPLHLWTTLGLTWQQHFDKYCGKDTASENGCWLWTGAIRAKDKYGQLLVLLPDGTQAIRSAHQAGWMYKHGTLPEKGLVLRHTCDVPNCCNPDHLLPGTQKENVQDMISRGRNCRGERSKHSKLTDEKVTKVRQERLAGRSISSLAKEVGVSPTLMAKVLSGERWKHIPMPENKVSTA